MKKKTKEIRPVELTKSRVDIEFYKTTTAKDPIGVVAALACVKPRAVRRQLRKAGLLSA